VIVLAPDLGGAKLYSLWQGPGTIVEVKPAYSYIVEVDGKKGMFMPTKFAATRRGLPKR